MKKIAKFFLAAVAMSAAVSCAQDLKEDMKPEMTGKNYVFSATLNEDTKTVLDEVKMKNLWLGDADGNEYITVMEPGTANKYVAKGITEATSKVMFELVEGGTGLVGNAACAVYPAGDWSCFATETVMGINVNFASEQVATPSTYDPNGPVAVAYNFDVAANQTFAFKNASALLKFQVRETETPVTSVKVTALGGEAIAGAIVLTLENGEEAIKGAETGALSTVELKGAIEPGSNYYIAVAPAVLAQGISVQLNNDEALTYKVKKEITLERSKVYNIGKFPYIAPSPADTPMGHQYMWWDDDYSANRLIDFGVKEANVIYLAQQDWMTGEWVSSERYTSEDLKVTQLDDESGYYTWSQQRTMWGQTMTIYTKLYYSNLSPDGVSLLSANLDEPVLDENGEPVLDPDWDEPYTYSGIGISVLTSGDAVPVDAMLIEEPFEIQYQEQGIM